MSVTNPPGGRLLIFLSHASQDKELVRELCQRLKSDGFDPWLDEERLLPGMDWNLEIEESLRASDVVLLCFSKLSIRKEGYIQREYKRAMKYREEKPEGTIYVIPVRLDDCNLPNFIRELQWVDYPAGYNRLVVSLNLRSGRLSTAPPMSMMKGTDIKTSRDEKPIGGLNINAEKVEIGGDVVGGSKYVFGAKESMVDPVQIAFKRIQVLINEIPDGPEIDKSYIRLFVENIQEEIQKGNGFNAKKLMNSLKLLYGISDVVYKAVIELLKSRDIQIATGIQELVDTSRE